MHYHAWAFAKDRSQPTILAKNGASLNDIGQANGFSESDLEGINKLHCKGTCYVDERATEDCKRWADAHCNGDQWGDWMKKNCAKLAASVKRLVKIYKRRKTVNLGPTTTVMVSSGEIG